MKKVIRLTESDLIRIVKRVVSEQSVVGAPNHGMIPSNRDEDEDGVPTLRSGEKRGSGDWFFNKGDTVKIPIKKPVSFIVIKIGEIWIDHPGTSHHEFKVIESTYDKMKKGYEGDLATNDDYTYDLEGKGIDGYVKIFQSGPITEIKKL